MKSSGVRKVGVLTAALLGILAVAPAPAQAAVKKIGVLITDNVSYYREIHQAFEKSLTSLGLQGISTELIIQRPARDLLSLTNAAKKLVTLDVDVIVTYGNTATLIVINETKKIPVVFAGVCDPEGTGLAKGNSRGISSYVPMVSLIKMLKGLANFSRLGVVFSKDVNSFDKESILQAKELQRLEGELQISLVSVNLKSASTNIEGTEALFLTSSCETDECRDMINEVALQRKLPSASLSSGNDRKVLLTIAANPEEQGTEAAKMVCQLMEKDSTATAQLAKPRKVDIVINMRQATALGLKVPFDLLTSATKVLQ